MAQSPEIATINDYPELKKWFDDLSKRKGEAAMVECQFHLGDSQSYLLVDLEKNRLYYNNLQNYSATVLKRFVTLAKQFFPLFEHYDLIREEKVKQTERPDFTRRYGPKTLREAIDQIKEAIKTGAFEALATKTKDNRHVTSFREQRNTLFKSSTEPSKSEEPEVPRCPRKP